MPRYLLTILSFAFLFPFIPAEAQVIKWPNPEVEQLYKSAQASLSSGAYKQAIASFQQAIALVPDQMVLHRDLARAFLLSGNPARAEKIIDPLLERGDADAVSYAVAANIQLALNSEKKARKMLDKGIEKFPGSGFLYHERGKLYEEQGDLAEALRQWVAGTAEDPAYHLNYYEAARLYMQTTKHVWAIIYGEIFINLERVTPRSGETRKLLLGAYQRFYGNPELLMENASKKKASAAAPDNFEDAVTQTLLKLAPVVADGVTTENLTMLRTRFAMEWENTHASKFPFTLFRMHDKLLRAGHFDAYNQWMFGRAENSAQFDAWVKFHPEAIAEYDAYYRQNPLQPTASDAYDHDISKKLFSQANNQYKR